MNLFMKMQIKMASHYGYAHLRRVAMWGVPKEEVSKNSSKLLYVAVVVLLYLGLLYFAG